MFKDDGFSKHKKYGRIDKEGRWPEIEARWLELYKNKTVVPELTAYESVTPDDEWLAEAYIQSDYSKLTDHDFKQTLLDFLSYAIRHPESLGNASANARTNNDASEQSGNAPNQSIHDTKADIEWRYYDIQSLFSIDSVKYLNKDKDIKASGSGPYPYISASSTDNGSDGHYNVYSNEGGVLTVETAIRGYCAYQPGRFSASSHLLKLTPKFDIDALTGLYLATIINLDCALYSYGRKCTMQQMSKRVIMLPSYYDGAEYRPAFDYMRQYMKSLLPGFIDAGGISISFQ